VYINDTYDLLSSFLNFFINFLSFPLFEDDSAAPMLRDRSYETYINLGNWAEFNDRKCPCVGNNKANTITQVWENPVNSIMTINRYSVYEPKNGRSWTRMIPNMLKTRFNPLFTCFKPIILGLCD